MACKVIVIDIAHGALRSFRFQLTILHLPGRKKLLFNLWISTVG